MTEVQCTDQRIVHSVFRSHIKAQLITEEQCTDNNCAQCIQKLASFPGSTSQLFLEPGNEAIQKPHQGSVYIHYVTTLD